MQQLKYLLVAGLVAAAASAGVVTDPSFEASGLPAWSPARTGTPTPPLPDLSNAPGVTPTNGSFYARLDSNTDNTTGGITLSLSQGITWATQNATLEFRLVDGQDPSTPANNYTGVRLDNVRFTGSGTSEHLLFDTYLLEKKDPGDRNGDFFQVFFGGTKVYEFDYQTNTDSLGHSGLLSTGDGTQAYSWGSDWKSIDLSPSSVQGQSVPEPASCLLLGLGVLPVLRRRRRRAA